MLIQYLGFDSSAYSRIYAFNVIDPPRATREFTVEVQSEEFGANRLEFQDGPAVSSERLKRELRLETQDLPAKASLHVGEQDIREYRTQHYPHKTTTSTAKKPIQMREEILTLLLHETGGPLDALIAALDSQAMRVNWAESFREAMPVLTGANPPHLVFTQSSLPDGDWADVVSLAEKATKPVNVIVVGRLANEKLYLQAMTQGAFDFIVPPLSGYDLTHVLYCAIGNVLGRREAQTKTARHQPSC